MTHAVQHDIALADVIPLVLGGLLGGPIGARLSRLVSGPRLMTLVSVAMVVAAMALILRHIF